MRRLAVLALVVTTVVPGAASGRARCALGKHDTVAVETRQAVIARRPNNRSSETYRGCVKSTDRWRVLHVGEFDGYSGSGVAAAALGGRYGAVAVFRGDHYNAGTTYVELVNLRTGHRRSPLVAGHADGDIGGSHFGISELAVSSHATLGWIAQEDHTGVDSAEPKSSVAAHDAAGTRVLDTASFEGLKKIRFRGTTLHWRHDGQPRSAAVGDR
jgi:hypothetical protein